MKKFRHVTERHRIAATRKRHQMSVRRERAFWRDYADIEEFLAAREQYRHHLAALAFQQARMHNQSLITEESQ